MPPFNQSEQPETESLRPEQPETESLRWEQLQYPPGLRQPASLQPQMPPQTVYMNQQSSEPPTNETMTRTYTRAKDFQKDQQRMAKAGWMITMTTSHQPRQVFGRMAAPGFIRAALFKPKPQYIVTYSRQVQPNEAAIPEMLPGPSFGKQFK